MIQNESKSLCKRARTNLYLPLRLNFLQGGRRCRHALCRRHGNCQDFEGKEVMGLSSVQQRNQNLLFAETAAPEIDVQQEARRMEGGVLWSSLTRVRICRGDRRRRGDSRLLNQDISCPSV